VVRDLLNRRIVRLNRRMVLEIRSTPSKTQPPFRCAHNEKGEALGFVTGTCEQDATGPSRTYNLTYKPDKNDRGPTKLVYRDRYSVYIEVPFKLKECPTVRNDAER